MEEIPENELRNSDYHEKKIYDSVRFEDYEIADHIFEDCEFRSCLFTKTSFRGTAFISCTFTGSTLMMCDLTNTSLNEVVFKECKIAGLNFTDCNKFAFKPEFLGCVLDADMFYGNNLRKAGFENCRLKNTDFIECNLNEGSFRKSEFAAVTFQNCNLEKAVFLEAKNYSIDPSTNRLKKAKFDLPEAQSFLAFLGIDLEE